MSSCLLRLFKILIVFSVFSLLLLLTDFSNLTFSQGDLFFLSAPKPILEERRYLFIQSNSFLPISNPNLREISSVREKETIIAPVTGYWLVEWITDQEPCIVASGLNACEIKKNIVACPRKYPFGTKVLINGIVYICEDRTNIKYDGVFDILFETEEEANKWGKRILPVTILN